MDIFLGNVTLLPSMTWPEESKVPAETDFREVGQFFSAKFIHSKSVSNSSVRRLVKSGEPGYDPGRPLITASVDSGLKISDSGIRHWHHRGGGGGRSLCREASPEKVKFMDDVVSGCLIRLQRENFTNCKALRQDECINQGVAKFR